MHFFGTELLSTRREEARATRESRAAAFLCLILLCIAPAALLFVSSRASAQVRDAPASNGDDRQRGVALFDEFRRTRNNLERRSELVDEILTMGKAPAIRLQKEIAKELEPLWRQYLRDFQHQATLLAKRNASRIDVQEVAQLRERFLAATAKDDLTKEDCQTICLPAITRLREILVGITRDEVLQDAPELESRRQHVLALAELWQRSRASAAADDVPIPIGAPAEQLASEEDAALLLVMSIPRHDLQVLVENRQLGPKIDAEEFRAIDDLNSMRLLLGLRTVLIDAKLCDAARDHSKDMKERNFFDHTSPVPGKTSFADRARNFGASASSENIFTGSSSGSAAHMAWFHSPGHHKNMFNANHRRIGVGRFDKHFTQLFGG